MKTELRLKIMTTNFLTPRHQRQNGEVVCNMYESGFERSYSSDPVTRVKSSLQSSKTRPRWLFIVIIVLYDCNKLRHVIKKAKLRYIYIYNMITEADYFCSIIVNNLLVALAVKPINS